MSKALRILINRVITRGTLTITEHSGASTRYGDVSGKPVHIRLADRAIARQIVLDPHLAFGEGYMNGQIVVVEGTLYDLLDLLARNIGAGHPPAVSTALDLLRYGFRRISQFNPRGRAERNVAHHYDIDASIYDLFLDQDRQYSCAYFADAAADIDTAQEAKKRHIAAKLRLDTARHILDIGSGWGGLGLYLAQTSGAEVTGVTLSREQLKVACDRASRLGLSRAVRFMFQDYRELAGQFDRIVSIGMFEHVGVNHYAAFFRKVAGLLTRDGVALIHAIGRSDGATATNAFIAKYIFPGGYIPALSEVLPAIERSGLIVTDIEILRLHYAETLRHWRERFLANRDKAVALRGEQFARMWEFYLAGSEVGFRHQNLMVFQIQLAKSCAALPITRDYMFDTERRLANDPTPLRETRHTA